MSSHDDHPSVAVRETDQSRDIVQALHGANDQERPASLDTVEARRLLEAVASAGVPEVVLSASGERDDLVELIAFGRSLQLSTSLLFEATPPPRYDATGEQRSVS